MTAICISPFARLALLGLLAVALGLAGCGRKSGLDAPPDASLAQTPAPQPTAPGVAPPIGSAAPSDYSGVDAEGKPIAASGQNRRIFLDHLLN